MYFNSKSNVKTGVHNSLNLENLPCNNDTNFQLRCAGIQKHTFYTVPYKRVLQAIPTCLYIISINT